MSKWRIWFWSVFVVICMVLIALVSAIWNNLSSEWNVEEVAAQAALNQSPIDHILRHDVFTGADVQEVFVGTDAFGRTWDVFVYGSPFQVHAVPASTVLSPDAILKRTAVAALHPTAVHLGYLDAGEQRKLNTSTHVVYEIEHRNSKGLIFYTYVDATSGKLLATY
ncbi:hypothetical protein GCM10025857_00890 [Alicyclobacillus contaminans]|uniref:hypothetical protein n=1 Tax=Alicyclobacillus contaminans TaxID=392016 RepID=UPI0004177621|nr:hypothetical protein [Alicyclobacillus contaminans]GMA48732.1 hypothetical protein GCM10025857_00890 [Alicyclobacillus contaminans]